MRLIIVILLNYSVFSFRAKADLPFPPPTGFTSKAMKTKYCLGKIYGLFPSIKPPKGATGDDARLCRSVPGCSQKGGVKLNAKECKRRELNLGRCISSQILFSKCVYGNIDGPHAGKIKDWTKASARCLRCAFPEKKSKKKKGRSKSKGPNAKDAAKKGTQQGSKTAAKKGAKKGFLKVAGKTILKRLGPIGAAYTVGEVGAAGINMIGRSNAQSISIKFAKKNLQNVEDLQDSACGRWQNAKFEELYCSIEFTIEHDKCGPLGFGTLKPGKDCESLEVESSEADLMESYFQEAIDDGVSCLTQTRTANIYRRTIDGKTMDCRSEESSGGPSSTIEKQ